MNSPSALPHHAPGVFTPASLGSCRESCMGKACLASPRHTTCFAIPIATLAVFAPHLAAFAARTRAANHANPLEKRIQRGGHPETLVKNGKNGNVHHTGQHCRLPPPFLPSVTLRCLCSSVFVLISPQGPGMRQPAPPLDKTPTRMAEWRAHDDSFMFARERRIRQIAARRELTPGRSVFTMAGIATHARRITRRLPDFR